MPTRSATLLITLLAMTNPAPTHAREPLHHWLHACDQPQLEYWQEVCRRSQVRQPPQEAPREAPRPPHEEARPRDAQRPAEAGKR